MDATRTVREQRRGAPVSPTERTAIVIAALATLGFGISGFATGSPSTLTYIFSVGAIGLLIRHFRSVPLPGALAIALAIHATAHLAGGLVNVGNDVLYNASIGPRIASLDTHLLQYDHFVHTFGSFVGTLTLWTLLVPSSMKRPGRFDLMILCVLAGLGVGAINEVIEFLATIAHTGAHVGGYTNTGWDLVANAIGGLVAGVVIWHTTASAVSPA
jgi:hypothetical protein